MNQPLQIQLGKQPGKKKSSKDHSTTKFTSYANKFKRSLESTPSWSVHRGKGEASTTTPSGQCTHIHNKWDLLNSLYWFHFSHTPQRSPLKPSSKLALLFYSFTTPPWKRTQERRSNIFSLIIKIFPQLKRLNTDPFLTLRIQYTFCWSYPS